MCLSSISMSFVIDSFCFSVSFKFFSFSFKFSILIFKNSCSDFCFCRFSFCFLLLFILSFKLSFRFRFLIVSLVIELSSSSNFAKIFDLYESFTSCKQVGQVFNEESLSFNELASFFLVSNVFKLLEMLMSSF